jgi:hypothetical protein
MTGSEAIVIVDSSTVLPGRLAELRERMSELAEFVDQSGTRATAYSFHLNPDETLLTVVQTHPDSESAVAQMEVAAPLFAGFRDLLTLVSLDIYGAPTPRLLELLANKARLLGMGGGPTVHVRHAGFVRC